MAFTAPTAADVKARFPEFTAVADATIDAVLAETGFIDERWIENDRRPAIMYYVAHTLVVSGQGSSASAKLQSVGDFTRIKSGDLEVSRSAGSAANSSSSDGTYFQTNYGKLYLELRDRSFPSVLMI